MSYPPDPFGITDADKYEWAKKLKIEKIWSMNKTEQPDQIIIGILAGDFTQDDVDYLFDRWESY